MNRSSRSGRVRRPSCVWAAVAVLAAVLIVWSGSTSALGVVTVGDTFTRSDVPPANDSLGVTEVGGFDWLERYTNGGAAIGDVAEITGGELLVRGSGSGTSNPGEAVVDVELPNVQVSSDMRFVLSDPSNSSTYNNAGFMLRKPRLDANIIAPDSVGQIEVSFFPTGALFIRERASSGAVIRYNDNPFAPGTTANVFATAGSLPTTINGAPFDVDGDARLEGNEPFQLGAILSGNRLQVLINDEPIVALNTVLPSGTSPHNHMALWKNRYTGGGTRTVADPYFDNFSAGDPGFVIRHRDDTDPLLENWKTIKGGSNVTVGPVTETIGGTEYEAWEVDDNYGGRWHYETNFTTEEIAAANANGWKYSMLMRVVDTNDAVDFSVHGQVADGTTGFTMRFGSDASGNALLDLWNSGQGVHTIAGGSVYHLYELIYDPAALGGTGAAKLLVDGNLLESDYAGVAFSYNRITWGSNQTGSSGQGNYAFVQFQIIPEPTSATLLVFGLIGMVGFVRRRRK